MFSEFVFVYGTLRRGERAERMLDAKSGASEYLHQDYINGRMYHLGGYPGVKTDTYDKFDPSGPKVLGEVYLVKSPSIITILDHYEGYRPDDPSNGLYNKIQVRTKKGRTVWVYTYNDRVTDEQFIETGDWKNPRIISNHRNGRIVM